MSEKTLRYGNAFVTAIVGSRNWHDRKAVFRVVDALPEQSVIISGGAPGVDTFAAMATQQRIKLGADLHFDVIPALWDVYGKSAGMMRNGTIVALADRIVAFWDGQSKGTADTIAKARRAGKCVEIHYADGRVEKTEGGAS